MRRIPFMTTVVAVAATMVMAGTALATPPIDPPSDSGDPSCFGQFARSAPGGPGPGETFVRPVTELFAPGGVDEIATEVGGINQARPCPPPPTLVDQQG